MEIDNDYEPFEQQDKFHNSKAKFRAIITGVGFGKSAAGANELTRMAIEYPKCTHLILAANTKILHNATLNQFWKFMPLQYVAQHKKSESTIYLKGGAKIIYLTADNERHVERLRGIEIGSFWLDEAALLLRGLWDIVLARLRDPKGPLKGIITTTPKGYNWLYYYFVKGIHPVTKKELRNKKDYEWFTGSTLDNPFTPEEYKKTLLDQYAGNFAKQELYGEFTSFEGMVYSNFKHKTHIIEKLPEFKEFIAGIDWGFTNPMACVIIGIDSDQRAYVIEEYYRKQQNIENLSEWLKLKKEKYNISNIYADPSEPMLISKLNDLGHNVLQANNEVMPGINFVYSIFEIKKDKKSRLYISNKCPHLLDEINSYHYAEGKEEKDAKEEPLKVNDHAVDAMRYALFTHLGKTGKFSVLPDPWG